MSLSLMINLIGLLGALVWGRQYFDTRRVLVLPSPKQGRTSMIQPEIQDKDLKYFRQRITPSQEDLALELLIMFAETLTQSNVTFFMTAGMLFGSYRHHGMIPWDDDWDLFLPESEKPRIYAALSKLQPRYRILKKYPRWKFFSSVSVPFKDYGWAWPFLDLIFYKDRGSYIQEIDSLTREKFNKSTVFPLIKRPFSGLMLPAPRNTLSYLKQRYRLNRCATNIYNHSRESTTPKHTHKSTDCKHLYNSLPFVFRHQLGSGKGTNETLWIGNRLISWILVQENMRPV